MRIKINEIIIDPAVAIRQGTDEDTIQRYMDTFNELPPIIIYQTDHKYLLADGFHRWAAASRLGHEDIEADVRQGSYQEASEYAIFANLKHGKPLSRDEYKNAVRRLSLIHPDWGTRKLSEAINRGISFIETVIKVDEIRRQVPMGTSLNDRVIVELGRAPKESWKDIAQAADEQEWTVEETAEKVREIKSNPDRIDEILALEPPQPRTSTYYQPVQLDMPGISQTLNDCFTELAEARIDGEITKELINPYAVDIYTWRDGLNELIKILEG